MRSTAMISATSDSTAATTSAVATCSLSITASRRLRDSASAGKASSASKASVRRRPWPSFWWRSPGAWARSRFRRGRTLGVPWTPRCGGRLPASASWPRHLPASVVDPFLGFTGIRAGASLFVRPLSADLARVLRASPTRRAGCSGAGRSAERAPRRCARASPRGRAAPRSRRSPARPSCRRAPRAAAGRPRAAWRRGSRRAPRARACTSSSLEARQLRERLGGPRASALEPVLAEPALARGRIVDRPVEQRPRQRPEVGERVDLLLADARGLARARRGR